MCCAGPVPAAVYQFAVPTKDVEGREIAAFLWVPPAADRLRGVLLGGQTLMEDAFAADPLVRRACTDEKLAIVYFVPPLDATFDYRGNGAGAALQPALDRLAAASGYRELSVAPWCPFGHSVSSIFAIRVVCWAPERCFGALSLKGGLPLPADDPAASVAGVPVLAIKGQFEEFGPGPSGVLRDFEDRETAWKGMRRIILGLREKDERHLIAYLVEPGASHFAWSERLAPYAAEFVRQAARQRIADWPADAAQPVKCRPLDPTAGALTGPELGRERRAAAAADFAGDRRNAFWHLGLDLAKQADALHTDLFARQPQFVTFADPKSERPIFVGHDLRLRLQPSWVGPDTFRVAGVFLDKAPDKYPAAPAPVGHAPGPVRFRVFAGAAEPTAADTFAVRLDGRGKPRAEVLAFHPGDATFRYAEQQGRMNLPARLNRGRPQVIAFPRVGPMRLGGPPAKLAATSDAGLPVRYYVYSGPAVVEGDQLRLADLPVRAAVPLKIVVVAYQYGSAVEPLAQSAEPVSQEVVVQK
jgi:hypothetical protein